MSWVDNFLCRIVDHYYFLRPQQVPPVIAPKIVSHRGVHNNVSTFENTINAFEAAGQCGAWGVELDVRWTKDGHPVVIHDGDCKRVFGVDVVIGDVTLVGLKERLPLVPTLSEVTGRFGRQLHLMIELKYEPYRDHFSDVLYGHLSSLEPCTDFHILSLDPGMFQYVHGLPAVTFLPVAEKNTAQMSRVALMKEYGGLTGHYLLINDKIIQTHKKHGQAIGTGFISSRNCLYREVNRGVDWIFTNDAQKLTSYCQDNLSRIS